MAYKTLCCSWMDILCRSKLLLSKGFSGVMIVPLVIVLSDGVSFEDW
jgi:hypothetical protein